MLCCAVLLYCSGAGLCPFANMHRCRCASGVMHSSAPAANMMPAALLHIVLLLLKTHCLQVATAPAIAFARAQMAYSGTFAFLLATWAQAKCSPVHAAPDADSDAMPEPGHPDSQASKQSQQDQPGATESVWCMRWLHRYAAFYGADADAMQSSLVFMWQACQKMLLQEASRCEATSRISVHLQCFVQMHECTALEVPPCVPEACI